MTADEKFFRDFDPTAKRTTLAEIVTSQKEKEATDHGAIVALSRTFDFAVSLHSGSADLVLRISVLQIRRE